MTDVMQSYNYNTLYAYQQQARLQGFGSAGSNQGGYGGNETNAPTSQQSGVEPPNPSLTNGSHEIPQIRGHVNVSMTHLQQEQQMPKLETDASQLNQQVPTNNQAQSQQQQALDQSMNYHQQQQQTAPQQQQQQQAPQSSETMNMKTYYDNEDEDTIIDEHFTKSFAPESRARLRHQSTFPASFYTQSASPQRSSSTSGYNGSLPGSVSPSSNPYATPGFPNQAVSQLYAAQQAAQTGFHPTTSPLATTNNGTTTATEWPYSSQYQQAFSHQQYQSTNSQATATTPTSSIHSHHYNQLAYPFAQQQEQHHRTPAFATGFPQY